jgi:hypothetical protein
MPAVSFKLRADGYVDVHDFAAKNREAVRLGVERANRDRR